MLIIPGATRLDLMYFVLAGPEPIDHVCKDDQFNVHGAAPVPSICGTNSGQHSKFKKAVSLKFKDPSLFFTLGQIKLGLGNKNMKYWE